MYKAYSVGIKEKDFELIRKIAQVVTSDRILIKDLRYYDIKAEDIANSVVLSFGNKASRLLKGISTKTTLFLPEINLLHSGTGSEEERQKTLNLLNSLKIKLKKENPPNENKIIKNDPTPNITIKDLKILENNLREKGVKNWEIIAENGKKINISIEPEESKADMNLTFSELYTLKIAMEVLSIKEFTIIYSKQNQQKG